LHRFSSAMLAVNEVAHNQAAWNQNWLLTYADPHLEVRKDTDPNTLHGNLHRYPNHIPCLMMTAYKVGCVLYHIGSNKV
jgi:hypothetical protein